MRKQKWFYLKMGFIGMFFMACQQSPKLKAISPLVGTWQLIASSSTQQDTTRSTFDSNFRMIKIINSSHFAFLNHNIRPDATTSGFTAGGGHYTLKDSIYTESLEYFSDKVWENHDFRFVIKIKQDTLIQKGLEKLEKLGINRIIVEKYKRINN